MSTAANGQPPAGLAAWPAPRGGYERILDELQGDLLPGEQVAASSRVTSEPSRWSAAVLGACSLALVAVGLLTLFGPLSPSPLMAAGVPVLWLGVQFLPRPMYVAVTNQRLIYGRIYRLRGSARRPVVAVSLADLQILNCRHSKFGASIQVETPGGKPAVLHWDRTRRADFARIEIELTRSGALAKSDPPYPASG